MRRQRFGWIRAVFRRAWLAKKVGERQHAEAAAGTSQKGAAIENGEAVIL